MAFFSSHVVLQVMMVFFTSRRFVLNCKMVYSECGGLFHSVVSTVAICFTVWSVLWRSVSQCGQYCGDLFHNVVSTVAICFTVWSVL